MAGLTGLILLVIVIAGRPQPPSRADVTKPLIAALPDADRIRAYQQQLADDEARLQQVQRAAAAAPSPSQPRPAPKDQSAVPTDDLARREAQSLFADNVAFTLRTKSSPTDATLSAVVDDLKGTRPPKTTEPQTMSSTSPAPTSADDHLPNGIRLAEGTLIDAVLLNRLDGSLAGPVSCLVTTPVYSRDRQRIAIPAGAKLLGTSSAVQNWGDSRLAISFQRLLMPDGRSYALDGFKGLDQIGSSGLKDEVSRHYWQVFGASIAIGGLSGLAQFNTHGLSSDTFADAYRQSTGASLSSSGSRVFDRYLNLLPTVTIREGHRIEVYLTGDLLLPAYEAVTLGGLR